MLLFHHLFLDTLPLIEFIFLVYSPAIFQWSRLARGPAIQDSGDVRRPESSRTTQNMLSRDPSIPLNQVQPQGSEHEDRDEQDNDYITYVYVGVRKKMTTM